jgi:hypothetical protein
MTISRAVVIAEIVSLVAALILVEWLAARFTRSSAFWPILVYAAIRLIAGITIRFNRRRGARRKGEPATWAPS